MKILTSQAGPFLPILKQFPDAIILALRQEFVQGLADMKAEPLSAGIQPAQDKAYNAAAQVLCAAKPFKGLPTKAQAFFDENLKAFLYQRVLDLSMIVHALDTKKPDILLLHNDVEPFTMITALWAKARGVPCLHIPHAVYQDINRGEIGTDVHDIVTASHLAAAGSFQAQWYHLRDSELMIKVTGLPQFDWWVDMQMDRNRARRLLNLNNRQPVITFYGHWMQTTNVIGITDESEVAYLNFLEAVKDKPVQIIVKCHPHGGQENWRWHVDRAKEANVECRVTPSHLEHCLHASDAVAFYGGSNVAIDAAHIPGLRIITIKGYEQEPSIYQATVDNVGQVVLDSLERAAPSQKMFLSRYDPFCDGFNHLRVAEFVKELCESESVPADSEGLSLPSEEIEPAILSGA